MFLAQALSAQSTYLDLQGIQKMMAHLAFILGLTYSLCFGYKGHSFHPILVLELDPLGRSSDPKLPGAHFGRFQKSGAPNNSALCYQDTYQKGPCFVENPNLGTRE